MFLQLQTQVLELVSNPQGQHVAASLSEQLLLHSRGCQYLATVICAASTAALAPCWVTAADRLTDLAVAVNHCQWSFLSPIDKVRY